MSFVERVRLFWEWFEENEAEIDDIIKYRNKDIIPFLSNAVKIISDNLEFNISRNNNFTFNIDGKNYLFYLTPRIISAMPDKLKDKWTFLPYIPSSNGVNFSIDIHNKKIDVQDIFVKIEFDDENDKFDLTFYNKDLNDLDKKEAYNIFFLIMENSIWRGFIKSIYKIC